MIRVEFYAPIKDGAVLTGYEDRPAFTKSFEYEIDYERVKDHMYGFILDHDDFWWVIDYDEANFDEELSWSQAEAYIRALNTLYDGRTVQFRGHLYDTASNDVFHELEIAIREAYKVVEILSDDECGMVIGFETDDEDD